MRITFFGVRGSTPVSGPEFARTGGHTSCIGLSLDDGPPALVLDAGTGLQRLAREFPGRPFRGAILLSHLHWDHLQGLPFCPPIDRDDAEVVLAQPAQGDPVSVLERSMSPPHFPIAPDLLRGRWEHVALEPGAHRFGEFDVVAGEVHHKGGRTFGFRIEAGGVVCCYVPDALDDNDDSIEALASGADVFVRGAPFLDAEHERAEAYGHGTIEHAIALARRAGVRRLVLTHHGPTRTDDELDSIAERLDVELAHEGQTLDVEGRDH